MENKYPFTYDILAHLLLELELFTIRDVGRNQILRGTKYRPMDLVVQSTSSEGGAVIAFLHFYRIVYTMLYKLKFHLSKTCNPHSSTR